MTMVETPCYFGFLKFVTSAQRGVRVALLSRLSIHMMTIEAAMDT